MISKKVFVTYFCLIIINYEVCSTIELNLDYAQAEITDIQTEVLTALETEKTRGLEYTIRADSISSTIARKMTTEIPPEARVTKLAQILHNEDILKNSGQIFHHLGIPLGMNIWKQMCQIDSESLDTIEENPVYRRYPRWIFVEHDTITTG